MVYEDVKFFLLGIWIFWIKLLKVYVVICGCLVVSWGVDLFDY